MKRNAKQVRAKGSEATAHKQSENQSSARAKFKTIGVWLPDAMLEAVDYVAGALKMTRERLIVYAIRERIEGLGVKIGPCPEMGNKAGATEDLLRKTPQASGAVVERNPVVDAHEELNNACCIAADLLCLMGKQLRAEMEDAPYAGHGFIELADVTGRRLKRCCDEAFKENLRNGGAQ